MEKKKIDKFPLIDSHAHLDELEDLPDSLEEAKSAGICGIIAVGMDIESNQKVLKINAAYPQFVYPAIGYHPWEIQEKVAEANLSYIQSHVKECVAIGEIGLDYKIKTKKELQIKIFERLLDTALEFSKPVILHCRYSHQQVFEMVKDKGIKNAVFHWYSGPVNLLDKILSMGYVVSATPALVYSPPHQEAIKQVPIDRILLETDTPVRYQGKESRPKDVYISLEEVSRLKRLDPESVAIQTTSNTSQFFRVSFPKN